MSGESAGKISNKDLEEAVRAIVQVEDLSKLTEGGIRKRLAYHFNTTKEEIDHRADEVSAIVKSLLDEMKNEDRAKREAAPKSPTLLQQRAKANHKVSLGTNGDLDLLKQELVRDSSLMGILEFDQMKPEPGALSRTTSNNSNNDEPPRKMTKLQREFAHTLRGPHDKGALSKSGERRGREAGRVRHVLRTPEKILHRERGMVGDANAQDLQLEAQAQGRRPGRLLPGQHQLHSKNWKE